MTRLKEYLAIPPSARIQPGRDVLGHVHSGDVLTHSLPRILRMGIILWFVVYALQWLALWLGVYEHYERWGLVQAFFAQMISLISAFVVVSITMERARHLGALPGDDFVFLRISSVFCRWLGEVVLVLAVGAALSAFLSPVSLPLFLLSGAGAAPDSLLGFGMKVFAAFAVAGSFLVFLLLYALATGIDLLLAIEFNTRAERISKTPRLAEAGVRRT